MASTDPRPIGRRGLLLTGLATASAASLIATGALGESASAGTNPTRYRYGSASNQQFGDLWLPAAAPSALVVLLHGGGFLSTYDLSMMNPIASAVVGMGYAAWNVEYRRVGNGGGFPNTFLDVAAAIDIVKGTPYDKRVIVMGYSSGGELAAWAASRSAKTGGVSRTPLRATITLSGGLDLTGNASVPNLSKAVTGLMGGTPQQYPNRYALCDPGLLLPASCPMYCVQADDDGVMRPNQARDYVAKATAAGGTARFVSVPGTHTTIDDPTASSWPTIAGLIKQLASG